MKLTLPALLCVATLSLPQFLLAKHNIPITFKIAYSSAYDDNILKYSQRDLDRFEKNTEVYPSEITTTDDWINTFRFRIYKDFKLGQKLRLRPYYSFRISLNATNEVRNLQSHFFLARLSYRYRYYLYLQYSYMPGYYLRIYKDRDLDQYHSCDFDFYEPSVKLRWRFKPFNLEGKIGQEYVYYNKYFTEYDSEVDFWGLEGQFEFPFDLAISAGYEFKVGNNVGFKQENMFTSTAPAEDTEYGDSSYEEDIYSFSASYPLPISSDWNWVVGLEYHRRMRYYQSELSLSDDPFHVGRIDQRELITSSIGFTLSPDLEVEMNFTYDERKTESPEAIVSSIKNFIHRTIELTLTYRVF